MHRCGSRCAALHEIYRKESRTHFVLPTFDPANEKTCGSATQLAGGDFYGSELRCDELRELDVVASDDRDLSRNADASGNAGLERADCDHVVHAEHGSGALLEHQQGSHRRSAVQCGGVGAHEILGRQFDTLRTEPVPESALPHSEGVRIYRGSDERNATMAELYQMISRLRAGTFRISRNAGPAAGNLV